MPKIPTRLHSTCNCSCYRWRQWTDSPNSATSFLQARPERRSSAVKPSLPFLKKLIASVAIIGIHLNMECASTIFYMRFQSKFQRSCLPLHFTLYLSCSIIVVCGQFVHERSSETSSTRQPPTFTRHAMRVTRSSSPNFAWTSSKDPNFSTKPSPTLLSKSAWAKATLS